ncbi:hypothetical protein GUITHDRAFT_116304 [Guillardia theta CCMP2712]|uniref:Uncharacterized protein n=2 Tax=Guillardia theta TaxID=55529 RepID=L1IN18_GUITC|nr:hypothetical protein GUITHDRAFT_116304 [Guillardia theta CCMP2712]EKX37497.1 hypothetical protein GUITHDRAFT_116304 [Guillardia theta CCMP2712]|eukprot:XP_005824477.1 hypothetical protein GUITHDRAFT_116304 [Guillardia theta CCMP2712]
MSQDRPRRNRRASSKLLEIVNSSCDTSLKPRLLKPSSSSRRSKVQDPAASPHHGTMLTLLLHQISQSAVKEVNDLCPWLSEYVDLDRKWLNPISTSRLGKDENDSFAGSLDATKLPECVGYSNYSPPGGFGWEKLQRGGDAAESNMRRRVEDFVDTAVPWLCARRRRKEEEEEEEEAEEEKVRGSIDASSLPTPPPNGSYDPPHHHLSLCVNEGGMNQPDFEDAIGEAVAIIQSMSESREVNLLSTAPADLKKMIVMKPDKFFERFKLPLGLDSLAKRVTKLSKQSSRASSPFTPRRLFGQLLCSLRFMCELLEFSNEVRAEAREMLLRFLRLSAVRILPAAIDGQAPFVHGQQWLGRRVRVLQEKELKFTWGVIDDYDGRERYHVIDDEGVENWWILPSFVVDLFPERKEEMEDVKVVSRGDVVLCTWRKIESIEILHHAEVVDVDFAKKGVRVKFCHLPQDASEWIDMQTASVILSQRVVTCYKNGRALYNEDSTPRSIARYLNASEEELVYLNRVEIPELHACSKLKRGTLLVLPVTRASEVADKTTRQGEEAQETANGGDDRESVTLSPQERREVAGNPNLMRHVSRRTGQRRLCYGSLAVRQGASSSFLGATVVVDCSDARHVGRVCAFHPPSQQYRIKLNPLLGCLEGDADAGEIYTSLPCEHVKVVRTILEESRSCEARREEQRTSRTRLADVKLKEEQPKEDARRGSKRKVEVLDSSSLLLLDGKPEVCASSVLSNLPDGPKGSLFRPNLRYREDGRLKDMIPLYDEDRNLFLTDDRLIDLFGHVLGGEQQQQAQFWQDLEAELSAGAGPVNDYTTRRTTGVSSEQLRRGIGESFARLNMKEKSSVLVDLLGEMDHAAQVSVMKTVIEHQGRRPGGKRWHSSMERGGDQNSSLVIQLLDFFFPKGNADAILDSALARRQLSSRKQLQTAAEQGRGKRARSGEGSAVGSTNTNISINRPLANHDVSSYSGQVSAQDQQERVQYDRPLPHHPHHLLMAHPRSQPLLYPPAGWSGRDQLLMYQSHPLAFNSSPSVHSGYPSCYSGQLPQQVSSMPVGNTMRGSAFVTPTQKPPSSGQPSSFNAAISSAAAADWTGLPLQSTKGSYRNFSAASSSSHVATNLGAFSSNLLLQHGAPKAAAKAQETVTPPRWPLEASTGPSSVNLQGLSSYRVAMAGPAGQAHASSGQSWVEPNLEKRVKEASRAGVSFLSDAPPAQYGLVAPTDPVPIPLSHPHALELYKPVTTQPLPRELQASSISGGDGNCQGDWGADMTNGGQQTCNIFDNDAPTRGSWYDAFLPQEEQNEQVFPS